MLFNSTKHNTVLWFCVFGFILFYLTLLQPLCAGLPALGGLEAGHIKSGGAMMCGWPVLLKEWVAKAFKISGDQCF
jgi:hypothetical protein